jgi:tRNA(Ile)-lysidine synthase
VSRKGSPAVRKIRAAVAAALREVPGTVGVACSGGPDSLVLLDAAVAVLGAARVVLVHVDHGLHPASGEVAGRVRDLGAALGVDVIVARVKVGKGASLEERAREARYQALEGVARERGLSCMLAGHTARDQAETVLLRVVRGTGPAGLAGIPPMRGIHRRPLLAIGRDEVEAYVQARCLAPVDDPMNADARFARVRMRAHLVPALTAENPQLEAALLRLARAAAEWTELVDARAAELVARARPTPTGVALAVDALTTAGPAAGKRALQLLAPALDGAHLDGAWHLVVGPARGGRGVDVPGARIERAFGDLVISHAAAPAPDTIAVAGPDGPYEVRTWRAGDRMRPARLRGRSRKLSDLYVDAKVPRGERASARVVVRARDGEIVWAEHIGAAAGAQIRIVPTRSARNPFQQ